MILGCRQTDIKIIKMGVEIKNNLYYVNWKFSLKKKTFMCYKSELDNDELHNYIYQGIVVFVQ